MPPVLATSRRTSWLLIRARVDGTLDRVLFTEGQDVKAGQPLAEIDPRPYAAVLEPGQGQEGADEAQFANRAPISSAFRPSSGGTSRRASRSRRRRRWSPRMSPSIAGDEAAIEAAQLNVEYCFIKSPVDGRIGLRLVDPGNLVRGH